MPKCKNDPTRSYKGIEPSPKGLGYCSHGMTEGDKKKGKDGNLWIIKKIKNGSLRWFKIYNKKNKILKLYLEPIITIFNLGNNDSEIFKGPLNNTPSKYKNIIINYLNKINKKFFDRMMFGVYMYTDFEDIRKKYKIKQLKNLKLKTKKFKINKNNMIYDIILNLKQISYYDYLLYAIKEEIISGADGWGENEIVFLDYKKINKLKLGKIDKNIAIDIFPVFKKIENK